MTASLGSVRSALAIPAERLLAFSVAPLVGSTGVNDTDGAPAATRYRFRINPDRLEVQQEKLDTWKLTQLAWERQYWGNDRRIFRYSGTTGVFRPAITAAEFALLFPNGLGFDIRTTLAWQKFKEFDSFYQSVGDTNIFMYWGHDDHEWEGALSGFSFVQDANKPFLITYQFTFTGIPFRYPNTKVNVVSGAASTAASQQMAAGTAPAIGGPNGIDTNPW